MTDAEIVALVARAIHQRFPLVLKYEAENLASVAVAALTEAGRLVPEGCVVIPRDAAERAEWACGTIAIQRWATNDPKTEAARLALSSALDKRDASEA